MAESSDLQQCQTPERTSPKKLSLSTPILSPIPIKRKFTTDNDYLMKFKIVPFRSSQTQAPDKLG